MARRKTSAADVGCLAVALLLAALAFLGPLALAVWALICEVRARPYRHARSLHDVLSADEQAIMVRAEREVEHYDEEIARVMQRGLAAGFVRRADGLFDARRFQARELNTLIETLSANREMALRRLDEVQTTLGDKLGRWLNTMSSLAGARAGLVAFALSFISITALGGGSLGPADLLFGGPGVDPGSRLAASLASVGIAAVAMFAAGSIRRSSLAA